MDDVAAKRKATPVYSGVVKYFPKTLSLIAVNSRIGNEQHNAGQPLHWAKEKSSDEADALTRHLLDEAMDPGGVDTDGVYHTTKIAWRALALSERAADARDAKTPRDARDAKTPRIRPGQFIKVENVHDVMRDLRLKDD